VILVASLTPEDFPTADILALYPLRWRIELAFKRLKSLLGLAAHPGPTRVRPDPACRLTC
jgi:IS4 transposase